MIPRRSLLACVSAAVLAAGAARPALAQDTTPYITAAQLDLTRLLPPPPPRDSALHAADVQAVLDAQASASAERVAQAVQDVHETVFDMFGTVLGSRFDPTQLPRTAAMFARIETSENATVDPAKPVFNRVRPYLADGRVKALVPASRSGSYPSGHTTRVTVMASVLASMLPGRKEAIWARAADYAYSRVIGGMHYPLDLEAGRRSGTAMAAILFANAAFLAEYEPARAELQGALPE